jgi:UDP-3-O-[3-hydroxymyristoyl] glucosamine N-acyltransferase
MRVSLHELAARVGGQISGNGDRFPNAARPLHDAGPDDLTLVESEKYRSAGLNNPAGAVVAPVGLLLPGKDVIHCTDPLAAFTAIVQFLHGRPDAAPAGIHPSAVIAPTARVALDVELGPNVVIGAGSTIAAGCRLGAGVVVGRDCTLGAGCVLFPQVVLYDGTVLGQRVRIHANSVLGADGFGYRFANGRHEKLAQLGSVEIGDDVEIGACVTIDRGTFGPTRIGTGTKIDNLVQVGHNCQVGAHNLFVSQMGIAGSSSTGNFVIVAGQVGIVDHVHLGDGVMIGAQAGVTKDVPAGQKMLGSPATPVREQQRILMTLEKLPEMRKQLTQILRHLGLASEAA